MEVVRVFNNELSSLYEVKPPISKAKMTQITKSAIKGIKFYKHIVQSVEKFIQKCRPEYKVPGLYVVDSIVRQSRHQFGPDKDVFGPRFVKNITATFQHLFKCAADDRPKIIRVLNLWQKNAVFPIDVIQPLLDMGHPNTSNEWPLDASADTSKESPVNKNKEESRHKSSDAWKGWSQSNEEPIQDNKTYAEMSTKNLEKFNKAEMSNAAKEDDASRSAMYKNQKLEKLPEETVQFNKKLLDFDYGDEEDEEEVKNEENNSKIVPDALALSMAQNLLSHPELLRQLQQMTASTIQPTETLKDMNFQSHPPPADDSEANYVQDMQRSPQLSGIPAIPYSENSSLMHFQYDKNGVPFQTQPPLPMIDPMNMDAAYPGVMPPDQHLMQNSQGDEDERVMYSMPGEPPLPPQDFDERQIMIPMEDRNRKERSRSRSGSRSRGRGSRRRSRSRSPRRKRSRSRSHSRKNRSRSRERERIREKERERERERERRRKGIPPIKKSCVSVCSTTLWLGHVPKSCSEVDISDTFSPFGTILSIDMIPPRGCAYVVMDRRQDGYRALQKLKNLKLQGSSIKMAWAPGKGVKGKEYKDYWEVELGVSYVPYDKIKEDAEILDLLEEGGFIDEDSLPEHLKALRKQPDEEKHSYGANKGVPDSNASFGELQTTPNMVPPPIIPPTSVNIPMVMPHLMQPQFGLHLPGMLPPQAMVMQVPMGIPPPAPMLMVQQQSQSILSNQPLPMVGGVPQIVPRTIPPATTAMPNKNSVQSELGLSTSGVPPPIGDATPTEEEGTDIASPNVQMSISGSASVPAGQVPSSQPVSVAQFNSVLGINTNRPILSVPPPVSTAGTPIPYPPPNMGFNFPPPGIRPPGQAHNIPPSPQFPWMQKQVGSPYTDADSSQSATSSSVRPVPPPQSGMPVHMFSNRPPFHESQSSLSNINSSPMKESHKGRDNMDRKPGDIEGNRNMSPSHHDKMIQEMVISTDDESSMDIEYSRNDMPSGPCFPNVPDFPRGPMNMQRMRGPPGPMPPGPRFRGIPIGSPFPMRMGGPRGMGGPGMHNRMDLEFSPHHGNRGPRLPMGPHGPRRNDGMHPPHDARDWYPRDFEGPPYERERDRRYRDDWCREPWDAEGDSRRNSRDRDDGRRDDHRESWNRDRPDNSRSSRENNEKNDNSGRQRDKSANKSKGNQNSMNDLQKMKPYQRGGNSLNYNKATRNDQVKDKPNQKEKDESNEVEKSNDVVTDQLNIKKESGNEPAISKKDKDREYRKRSRWGRTLSEEREFQQQKRNEIEMKFQSYEQSHAAQQPPQDAVDVSQNSNEIIKEEPQDVADVSAPSSDMPIPSTVETSNQITVDTPDTADTATEMPAQNADTAVQNDSEMLVQNSSDDLNTVESNVSTDIDTNTQSEPLNSSVTVNNDNFEAAVTESNTSCSESVSDMNENSDVTNSTNENNVVPGDVITNTSSLVSTES